MYKEDILPYFSTSSKKPPMELDASTKRKHQELCPIWLTGLLLVLGVLFILLPIGTQILVYFDIKTLDITMLICLTFSLVEVGSYVGVLILRQLPGFSCTTTLWNKRTAWCFLFYTTRSLQAITILFHYLYFPWNIHTYETIVEISFLAQFMIHSFFVLCGVIWILYCCGVLLKKIKHDNF